MTRANDLIDRMERETGQRVDAEEGDNMAMAGLFGALARALGQARHNPHDDVAAGIAIRHRMSPAGRAEQRGRLMMSEMLAAGMPPEVLGDLTKK